MTTLFQLHWAGTQHLRRWLRTEVKALPEVSDSVVSIKDQFLTAQYTGHSSLATLSLYLLNKHCHGLPYTSLTCICLVRCHRSCTYAGHALLQSDLLLHSNWSLSQNHKQVLPFAPPHPHLNIMSCIQILHRDVNIYCSLYLPESQAMKHKCRHTSDSLGIDYYSFCLIYKQFQFLVLLKTCSCHLCFYTSSSFIEFLIQHLTLLVNSNWFYIAAAFVRCSSVE